MFKMLIGITFLNVIADIILSDGSFKKYIKTIIGLFVVIIIVEGMFNIKPDFTIMETIERETQKNIEILNEDIREVMIKDVKEKITKRLGEEGIILKEFEINLDADLNVRSLVIRPFDVIYKERIITILSEEFLIDKSVIGVG